MNESYRVLMMVMMTRSAQRFASLWCINSPALRFAASWYFQGLLDYAVVKTNSLLLHVVA